MLKLRYQFKHARDGTLQSCNSIGGLAFELCRLGKFLADAGIYKYYCYYLICVGRGGLHKVLQNAPLAHGVFD
jgi:hypothetical protein